MHAVAALNRRVGRQRPARRSQRGAIAIIVGLTMVVMVGFVGLAIDGGRLYLTKTELQNAADACALAASYELTGAPTIAADAFTRAEAAGRKVATLNKVGFQGATISSADVTLAYSDVLNGAWSSAGAGNTRYVRCTIAKGGIQPYFMQVMANGPMTVNAIATATLAPSQSNCAVPMALCTQAGGSAPNYGYVVGNWYGMDFNESGGSNANYTGNFRWIDFDPSSGTPGCSGGGAQELACLLAGPGQCSLPQPITGSCSSSGNASPTPGCVGQNGAINSLEQAYNTRFGMYKGSYSVANSPPDFSGYSYNTTNWPDGRNAFSGTGAIPNLKSARTQHLVVQSSFVGNGGGYSTATQAQYAANGADRRLVVMPIVDCAGFVSGQHAPTRGYACVMLVDPYNKGPGNVITSRLEYLGRSNTPGSPCASTGIAGDATSQGPMVPALVQ